MDWSQIRSTALVALLAVVTIVGFVAPVSAIDDGQVTSGDEPTVDDGQVASGDESAVDDGATTTTNTTRADGATTTDTTQADEPVPEAVCTDVTGVVHEEVPYDQVLWVDDLPEDAQPPGVPWTILTPRAVGGLALGVAPNQCDVVDPNDPPYDPREDDVDPDADADVVEETDDGTTLIVANGTLNRSAEGPGGEATIEFDAAEDGEVDPKVALDDGEKDYGVDPGLQYWSDGTIYAENDVTVIGMTGGGEVDCIGEECTVDVRGAPKLADYPSVPSHSSADPREDADEGTSVTTGDASGVATDTAGDGGSDGSDAAGSSDADTTSDGTDAAEASDDGATDDATPEATDADGAGEGAAAAQGRDDGDDGPLGGGLPTAGGLGALLLLGVSLIAKSTR